MIRFPATLGGRSSWWRVSTRLGLLSHSVLCLMTNQASKKSVETLPGTCRPIFRTSCTLCAGILITSFLLLRTAEDETSCRQSPQIGTWMRTDFVDCSPIHTHDHAKGLLSFLFMLCGYPISFSELDSGLLTSSFCTGIATLFSLTGTRAYRSDECCRVYTCMCPR